MSTKVLSVVGYLAVLGSAHFGAACQHVEPMYHDIALNGFSDGNYPELNRSIGTFVCIRGRMSIDTAGVYFALQPIEDGDIIDIGFSRIISGLSLEEVRRDSLVNGENHRVCGILRDATPFRQCAHDHCKWYRLENAELR